jgi:phosphohistidine phosphatase SixA
MRSPLPLLLLTACATAPVVPGTAPAPNPAVREPATVVFVVRHAEKAAGDDPPLTETGQARAEALVARMADEPLVAVYTTPYQRTRQTVAPTAEAQGLALTVYDPSSDLPARIIVEHAGQAVLVAGHSNTVPAIVAGLGAQEPAEIPHERYGDLYMVTRVGGDTALEVQRFGE